MDGESLRLERFERQQRMLELRRRESEQVFWKHQQARAHQEKRVRSDENKFQASFKKAKERLHLSGEESLKDLRQKTGYARLFAEHSQRSQQKMQAGRNELALVRAREKSSQKITAGLARRAEKFLEKSTQERMLREKKFIAVLQEEILENWPRMTPPFTAGEQNVGEFSSQHCTDVICGESDWASEELICLAEGDGGCTDVTQEKSSILSESQRAAELPGELTEGEESDFSGGEKQEGFCERETVYSEIENAAVAESLSETSSDSQDSESLRMSGISFDQSNQSESGGERYACFEQMVDRLKNLRWWSEANSQTLSFSYDAVGEPGLLVEVLRNGRREIQISLYPEERFPAVRLSKIVALIREQMRTNRIPIGQLKVHDHRSEGRV